MARHEGRSDRTALIRTGSVEEPCDSKRVVNRESSGSDRLVGAFSSKVCGLLSSHLQRETPTTSIRKSRSGDRKYPVSSQVHSIPKTVSCAAPNPDTSSSSRKDGNTALRRHRLDRSVHCSTGSKLKTLRVSDMLFLDMWVQGHHTLHLH